MPSGTLLWTPAWFPHSLSPFSFFPSFPPFLFVLPSSFHQMVTVSIYVSHGDMKDQSIIFNSQGVKHQWRGGQSTMTHWPNLPVFVNEVLEHGHVHHYGLSTTTFMLQEQSWIVATGTTWFSKPKMFTTWLFTKQVCQPLFQCLCVAEVVDKEIGNTVR